MCAWSFICATSSGRTVAFEITTPKVEKNIGNSTQTDSVGTETELRLKNQIDSLRRDVVMLQDQHEHALDDLRQETNNIINKLNGWLGFWIAVCAIICGILPIVCQYFIVHQFEKEYKEDFRKQKDALERMISGYSEEINRLKEDFDHEKNRVIRNLEEKVNGPEVQSLLAQYRIGNDSNLVNEGTSIFNAFQWNTAVNGLQTAFQRILTESCTTLSITERYELQKCLIQASGFIQEVNRHIRRGRDRGIIETDIHTLFEQLENGDYGDIGALRDQFNGLFIEMRTLIL